MYPNYATNSALFRNQYGTAAATPRTNNNSHHPNHNAGSSASAVPNPHFQNNAAGALGYPTATANSSNSGPHWNPADSSSGVAVNAATAASSAASVPTFSDYAAAAAQPQ